MSLEQDIQRLTQRARLLRGLPSVALTELTDALTAAQLLVQTIQERRTEVRAAGERAGEVDVSGLSDEELQAQFNAAYTELEARGRVPEPGVGRSRNPGGPGGGGPGGGP